MPKLTYLIIHCTATPEGREVLPRDIWDWHTNPVELSDGRLKFNGEIYKSDNELPEEVRGKRGRGWRVPGYSDMILANGALHNLRPYDDDDVVDPWEITNGVAGINDISRHVVYVGGCDKKNTPRDTRTQAQRETLALYVKRHVSRYPSIKVAGHNQFANKACPSFDVPAWLRSIGCPEQNIHE